MPATTTATRLVKTTQVKSTASAAQKNFRHGIKQVGMSQRAEPAMQNDMTTGLEIFEKERFCSFPHRHGEATGKPETIFILCSFKSTFSYEFS